MVLISAIEKGKKKMFGDFLDSVHLLWLLPGKGKTTAKILKSLTRKEEGVKGRQRRKI